MDDDLIDAIADALADELAIAEHVTNASTAIFRASERIAEVINMYEPTYDLRYFYKRVGYPEPYPEHPVR